MTEGEVLWHELEGTSSHAVARARPCSPLRGAASCVAVTLYSAVSRR